VRYRVFYEELGARAPIEAEAARRDTDRFDLFCDHLLVLDTALPGPEVSRIVGTYRLIRDDMAAAAGGFYSESEFELRTLAARHPDISFLELGRSCVLPAYRGKRTIELLWQGCWAYVNHYGIGLMTGCASFHGTVPAAHAEALSFLHHHCRASGDWAIRAVPDRAKIGEGCVVDHAFGTVDVCIVLPVAHLDPRYVSYYSPDATRFAA
jgi:putative hemolysin